MEGNIEQLYKFFKLNLILFLLFRENFVGNVHLRQSITHIRQGNKLIDAYGTSRSALVALISTKLQCYVGIAFVIICIHNDCIQNKKSCIGFF